MVLDLLGAGPSVLIDGTALSLDDVVRVAKRGCAVHTTTSPSLGTPGTVPEDIRPVVAGRSFSDGAGGALPASSVRAAMLLHANTHLDGASRIRPDVIDRVVAFLNAGATPVVPEQSAGDVGDVIPLSAIIGALIGRDDSFQVDFEGETIGARAALRRLGLQPLALSPAEALASIGGAGVTAGAAVECLHDAYVLLAVVIGTSALFVQACPAADRPFHPFVRAMQPSNGHRWAAAHLATLLTGSTLPPSDRDAGRDRRSTTAPAGDASGLPFLALLFGPIVDGLGRVAGRLRDETNAAPLSPAVDPARGVAVSGGGIDGEAIGSGLDQLRFSLGILARHLDVQVGAVWNELVGHDWVDADPVAARRVRHALAGLRACGGAVTPLIAGLDVPFADRPPDADGPNARVVAGAGFPTIEQTREAIALSQQHLAIGLIFAAQGVDLRTRRRFGHYDAGRHLSPPSVRLYEAVRAAVEVPACPRRPFVWDGDPEALDDRVARIACDLAIGGEIEAAVAPTLAALWGDVAAPAPIGGGRVEGVRA